MYNISVKGGTMKRRDLLKLILNAGFKFERYGSNHDIYVRGKEIIEVPRHKEVKENLAREIIKKYRLK